MSHEDSVSVKSRSFCKPCIIVQNISLHLYQDRISIAFMTSKLFSRLSCATMTRLFSDKIKRKLLSVITAVSAHLQSTLNNNCRNWELKITLSAENYFLKEHNFSEHLNALSNVIILQKKQ